MLDIYTQFLRYKLTEGEQFARLWLDTIIDYWYVEDIDVVSKYIGLNQFKLWKITSKLYTK